MKEAVYALALEVKFTKDEVLTIYLNRAFLGAGARGFEAASQRYFGRSANEVNPAEAAMLAGLLVAPSRFAPTNNIERSRARAETVLKLMREQGYLTNAEHTNAVQNPASLSEAAAARAGRILCRLGDAQRAGFPDPRYDRRRDPAHDALTSASQTRHRRSDEAYL